MGVVGNNPGIGCAARVSGVGGNRLRPICLFLNGRSFFVRRTGRLLLHAIISRTSGSLGINVFGVSKALLSQTLRSTRSLPFFKREHLIVVRGPLFLATRGSGGKLRRSLN